MSLKKQGLWLFFCLPVDSKYSTNVYGTNDLINECFRISVSPVIKNLLSNAGETD